MSTVFSNVPTSALIAIGASLLASLAVVVLIWRRGDPVTLKVAVTVVAFLPIVGPLFALWILSFPDRMHPALRATHPKVVNSYSSPHVGQQVEDAGPRGAPAQGSSAHR